MIFLELFFILLYYYKVLTKIDKNDQILEITLQLSSGTSGTFCQERNHYPWGQ